MITLRRAKDVMPSPSKKYLLACYNTGILASRKGKGKRHSLGLPK